MTPPRRGRLCLACEVIHGPLDEGVRIFAASLARCLATSRDLLLISEKDSVLDGMKVHGALANRYFLSPDLARLVAGFAPGEVVYVSWTSLTARAILRSSALRSYARGARVGLVALQPRPSDALSRLIARVSGPDVVLTAGPGVERQARALGLRAARVGAGVDLARFSPAAPDLRAELRRRAGIEPDDFVALHVGHLKGSRNIDVLGEIARLPRVRCLLVASSSTPAEADLAARLGQAGVIVMSHHQDRIERVYQLADAYLFPVTSELDAIETPLSVLEAAACDLTIVSTPFGGLPDLMGSAEGSGVRWVRSTAEMIEEVGRLSRARPEAGASAGTRRLVESATWEAVALRALAALEAEPPGGRVAP